MHGEGLQSSAQGDRDLRCWRLLVVGLAVPTAQPAEKFQIGPAVGLGSLETDISRRLLGALTHLP